MQIGYKLTAEAFGPKELHPPGRPGRAGGLRLRRDERPLPSVAGSPGAQPVHLVGAARDRGQDRADRAGDRGHLPLGGITRPSSPRRAATLALISDGRFTLGVGAGERLNEHVVGTGFPARRVRHERFREALEIIRLLWQGGYRSYDGQVPAAGGRPRLRPPRRASGDRRRGERAGIGQASPRSSATGCSPPSPTPTW